MVGIDIYWNAKNKNKKCQVWFVLRILWAKSPHDLQGVLKVLSGPSWEHYPAMKAAMDKQYHRLISGYEVLLNRTEFILSWSNNNNPIRTIAKILETLMIQCTEDSNWFNGLIINILIYMKSIIEVLFLNDFRWYLIEMENKIKQLLAVNKFEYFFEKAYKIRVVVAIPWLLRLIHNNSSLDLT